MKTIEIEHDVGDVVRIIALDLNGYVLTVSKQFYGIRYEVAYWCDGKRSCEYVFANEIRTP